MSILDQTDIDALLASASDAGSAGPTAGQDAPAVSRGPRKLVHVDPERLRRILHIRLPVIVTLAERKLAFEELLKIAPGSIIEFDRASDAEPDLAIGNRKVGSGQAVKVGEYFGLRVTDIDPIKERIRAMGM